MLLTSSQVSIALSSAVVILFTLALFLSGYAIQQRTLRDLRAAIKPQKPEPKIFLPDRFRQSTTELSDGTIIEVDDNAFYNNGGRSGSSQKQLKRLQQQQRSKISVVVEVKPTLQTKDRPNKGASNNNRDKGHHPEAAAAPKVPATRNSNRKESPPAVSNPSKANMEKKTKNENPDQKESNPELTSPPEDYVEHPDDPQKVVSRAERRRLIKENLQKISMGEEKKGYYQRRMW